MQSKKSQEQIPSGTKVCFLGVYVIMLIFLKSKVCHFSCAILLLQLSFAWAQVSTPPDSSSLEAQAALDSSKVSTVNQPLTNINQDSTLKSDIKLADVGLSKPVNYTYKTMITEKTENGRVTRLLGDATVKFGDITIKAGKITIRWNDNLLIAESLPGSGSGVNGSDSLAAKKNRPADLLRRQRDHGRRPHGVQF